MTIAIGMLNGCIFVFVFGYISRRNELKADFYAANITGDPTNLMNALQKLDDSGEAKEESDIKDSYYKKIWSKMLMHPPTEERISRLKKGYLLYGG